MKNQLHQANFARVSTKLLTVIFCCFFLLLLFSCDSDNDPIVEPEPIVKIEAILIKSDVLYGAGAEGIEESNLVLTDEDSWIDLIGQMNSVNEEIDPSSAEATIDFSVYKVIAVFDKAHSQLGYGISVSIENNAESILATVTKTFPPGDVASDAFGQPYQIWKITASDLPVIFQ